MKINTESLTKKLYFLSCNRLGWKTFAACLRKATDDNKAQFKHVSHLNIAKDESSAKRILKDHLYHPSFVKILKTKTNLANFQHQFPEKLLESGSGAKYHWFGHLLFNQSTIPKNIEYSVSTDGTRAQRLFHFAHNNIEIDDAELSESSRQEKLIFENAKVIHATSNWAAEHIESYYSIDPAKIFVEYYPVASYFGSKQVALHNRKWLTFIGNDFSRKGGDVLVEVHQKYFSEHELHIVGPTKNIRKNLKNVIWHGSVSNEYVHTKVLPNTRALVLPTSMDMTPIVCIEAASHGIPVVSADVGAINELVIHGQSGVLFNDIQAMCAGIDSLLSEEETYAHMSGCALQHFKNKLKADISANSILSKISEIAT